MTIVHERNAPSIEVPAPYTRTLTVLLSPVLHPELQSLAAGLVILPPGSRSENHTHKEGEFFYVISGKGRIRIAHEEENVIAGTAVWGPPGIPHQIINTGYSTLKILWVLSPPGRERMIIETFKKRKRE